MLKLIRLIGKITFSLITLLVLIYSVLMMLIDVIFSLLSLTPKADVCLFITEHAIPNFCGVISIAYCILTMVRKFIVRHY